MSARHHHGPAIDAYWGHDTDEQRELQRLHRAVNIARRDVRRLERVCATTTRPGYYRPLLANARERLAQAETALASRGAA